jgi:thioredoxin-like negative regulator of GroEL
MTELLVLAGTLAVAATFGWYWRARQGRISATASTAALPADIRAVVDPSASITFVQLSTQVCAQCGQTRKQLTDLVERTTGLAHVEIDLTERLDLARDLRVMSTPTTLVVDAEGTEMMRVTGVPQRETLLRAVSHHLPC